MALQRIEKDAFFTETMVTLARFADFLLTVESSLQTLKESGLQEIARLFGSGGCLVSGNAKRLFNAHRKRYDRDMGRILRYSAVTSLYTLLETTARRFIDDFDQTHPGKRAFRIIVEKHSRDGFVKNLRHWLELTPAPVILRRPRIWSLLDDLRVIRNCITHLNGDLNLESDRKRVARCREVVRRTRKIRFDTTDTLVLDEGFSFEVCEKLHAFFRLLFQAAGYGMALPPGFVESLSKNFAGFEKEIAEGIEAYEARQTINLGGLL
jgi:hypothetical protein